MVKNKKTKTTFLSFKIGNETFAVSVHKALEVLEKQHITEVPNVPVYIKGVINFRGHIIPVIDTRAKFNLPLKDDQHFVIIVFDLLVNDNKMLVGAKVDCVSDVISIDESSILAVPELGFHFNTDYLLGMLQNEKGFTMILDIDKVFASEEVHILQQSSDIEIPDTVTKD